MAVQELKTTDHEKQLCYCRWFNQFIEENTSDVLDETLRLCYKVICKIQDCGHLIIFTVCTKHPYMIKRLVCGLRFPDVKFFTLFSL